MSFRARQPGRPCCDDDCRIDIAGWNQVAGTWAITGDNLETANSNALAVTSNEHPEAKSTHYLSAIINGENAGDIFRFVVAYSDANNYLYGEVETDTTEGTFRLFQVTGGSHFQLGLDSSHPSLKVGDDLTIRVCFRDDGLLTIQKYSRTLSTIQTRYMAFVEGTVTGKRVGFATGALHASSTAAFTSIQWQIHKEEEGYYTEGNDCPECREIATCNNCKDNIGPSFFKVVIAGLGNTGTCPCDTYNRTMITQHSNITDGVCIYRYFPPEYNMCDNFTVYGQDQLDVEIHPEVRSFAGLTGTGNIRVWMKVLQEQPRWSYQYISFLYSLTEPIECLKIKDEVANAQGTVHFDDPCTITGATATITAI